MDTTLKHTALASALSCLICFFAFCYTGFNGYLASAIVLGILAFLCDDLRDHLTKRETQ